MLPGGGAGCLPSDWPLGGLCSLHFATRLLNGWGPPAAGVSEGLSRAGTEALSTQSPHTVNAFNPTLPVISDAP